MNRILFATIILIIAAWAYPSENQIKKAEWLIGTWECKTPKGSIYETWTKKSGEELLGKSYFMRGEDSITYETIRLVQEKNSLLYIPTVVGQNNNLPVRFTSSHISDGKMIFENVTHDFPQQISYAQITTDSLVAEISGIINSKERREIFAMKRLK